MELYNYWRSSSSWRVRWVLDYKKIDYKYIPVNLLKGEHKKDEIIALNPSMTVPFLKIKKHVLTQSVAIILYLENEYTQNPILPKDSFKRAQVMEICEIINSSIHPLQNLGLLNKISDQKDQKIKWANEIITNGFKILLKHLPSTKDYCLNNEFSLADIFLIPQIYNGKRFGIDMEKEFPQLFRIYSNCLQLPSAISSKPEKQIDAF